MAVLNVCLNILFVKINQMAEFIVMNFIEHVKDYILKI